VLESRSARSPDRAGGCGYNTRADAHPVSNTTILEV